MWHLDKWILLITESIWISIESRSTFYPIFSVSSISFLNYSYQISITGDLVFFINQWSLNIKTFNSLLVLNQFEYELPWSRTFSLEQTYRSVGIDLEMIRKESKSWFSSKRRRVLVAMSSVVRNVGPDIDTVVNLGRVVARLRNGPSRTNLDVRQP